MPRQVNKNFKFFIYLLLIAIDCLLILLWLNLWSGISGHFQNEKSTNFLFLGSICTYVLHLLIVILLRQSFHHLNIFGKQDIFFVGFRLIPLMLLANAG